MEQAFAGFGQTYSELGGERSSELGRDGGQRRSGPPSAPPAHRLSGRPSAVSLKLKIAC